MFRVDFSEPVVGLDAYAFTASTGDVTGVAEVAAGDGSAAARLGSVACVTTDDSDM